jgi:hypothetical protein
MKKKTPDDFTKFLIMPDQAPVGVQSDTVSPSDEHLLKIIDECYSVENIEVKTDLNDAMIKGITKAKSYDSRFNCPLVTEISQNIMVLSVSKGREGRHEFKAVATSMTPQPPVYNEVPQISNRLFGGRRRDF